MKPAAFDYVRPTSLDEALSALHAHGGDAKALAGGQSLVPMMNFRLAQPAVLVDLNHLPGLSSVERVDSGVRIGGLTRHRTLEHHPLIFQVAPLVAEAMPLVGHPPIRTRGTIGGSLAHADPAAELPAVMLALGATIGVQSTGGARTVAAADFFVGLYETALRPDELVTEVFVDQLPPRTGCAIDEVARRHGDYALAGVAALVSLDDAGRVGDARIVLLSVHDRPVLATHAARALAGERPSPGAVDAAADAASRLDANPSSDIHASSAYRRHLVRVLLRRAVNRAVARARHA